jgi:hypothetical protein
VSGGGGGGSGGGGGEVGGRGEADGGGEGESASVTMPPQKWLKLRCTDQDRCDCASTSAVAIEGRTETSESAARA